MSEIGTVTVSLEDQYGAVTVVQPSPYTLSYIEAIVYMFIAMLVIGIVMIMITQIMNLLSKISKKPSERPRHRSLQA